MGRFWMISQTYLLRQAETLLKLARSSADPDVAGALIQRAADLKAKVDEARGIRYQLLSSRC